MPYTILKTSRSEENQVEVLGEFADKDVAYRFAGLIERDEMGGVDDNYSYTVESPMEETPAEVF